ncbi:MAG: trypsin-like peptidase domain-containing protein [Clostridia bacterium]|nr:trypsin-like peptidase domain-containing protein [Clostridia bacterium]
MSAPRVLPACSPLLAALLLTAALSGCEAVPHAAPLTAAETAAGAPAVFDGTLPLHPRPAQETLLTVPEIAATVSPSVVGVVAEGGAAVSYGSGILMSGDGFLVTNAHVISGAAALSVVTAAGEEYPATVVGSDRQSDLAVLKVEAEGLPAAVFGDSSACVPGEMAVAIGNPLSMELFGSVTAGILSAVDRRIVMEDRTMELLQTDAAINPGNSGGALVDGYGRVIGINSVKVTAGSYEGIGFAIPTAAAKPIIDDLLQFGYVPGRPAIGIVGEDVRGYYAAYFGVPQGVYLHSVTPGSGAAGKGLKTGDIVIGINGIRVESMAELNRVKADCRAGDVVTLRLWRQGTEFEVEVVLTEAGPEG